jgi:hypothetical protein
MWNSSPMNGTATLSAVPAKGFKKFVTTTTSSTVLRDRVVFWDKVSFWVMFLPASLGDIMWRYNEDGAADALPQNSPSLCILYHDWRSQAAVKTRQGFFESEMRPQIGENS